MRSGWRAQARVGLTTQSRRLGLGAPQGLMLEGRAEGAHAASIQKKAAETAKVVDSYNEAKRSRSLLEQHMEQKTGKKKKAKSEEEVSAVSFFFHEIENIFLSCRRHCLLKIMQTKVKCQILIGV